MNDKKPNSDDNIVQIKKYANRRLYNMQTSSYITLDDLATLVREEINFIVVDAKTGDDLTRPVLVQIILEQESAGAEMLPTELLRSLIRYCDTDMHHSFSQFLASTMSGFTKNQDEFMKNMGSFGSLEKIQEQQKEWFNKAMEMMNPLKPSS